MGIRSDTKQKRDHFQRIGYRTSEWMRDEWNEERMKEGQVSYPLEKGSDTTDRTDERKSESELSERGTVSLYQKMTIFNTMWNDNHIVFLVQL